MLKHILKVPFQASKVSLKIDLWFSKFNINLNRAERRRIINEKYNSKYQIKEILKALNK